MKKILNLCLVITLLFCFFAPSLEVNANTGYEVYIENGGGMSLLSSFGTYEQAHTFALSKEQESISNNMVIYESGRVKYATYALVNFKTKASEKINTEYTIEFNNREGYTNGFYGADGAFLGTSTDGTRVRFMQSGVIGWVNLDEVELVVMDQSTYNKIYTNSYIMVYTDAWELRHNVTTDIHSFKQGSALILGQERPYGMNNATYYLSYDGHYFYPENLEGYRAMMRDYKTGVRTNSINPNNPYYNYYQFLSHRSISNYTSDQLRQDLSGYIAKPTSYDTLKENESLLFGEEISFIQYQNEFGANAILAYGTAQNESASGRSPIAIKKNNLFGHSAFDSSPGSSAASYPTVSQSILYHTKTYISEGYADPCDGYQVYENGASSQCHKGRYYGSNVGDKSSGMNVKYASDPYWGEKAAKNYYYFDKKYGLQDYGKYGIGIKTSTTSYPIKSSPSLQSATLYNTGNSNHYAVTILETVTGESVNGSTVWYKIQTDPTLNGSRTGILQDQGNYNFEHNVGYIPSAYLGYVRGGNTAKARYTINFDPNGGTFNDNVTTVKSLTVEQYVIPEINAPSKEGYRFIGWDKAVVGATENVTYKAVYEPIYVTHEISFHAGMGIFQDGSKIKKLNVKAGEVPNIEAPTLNGYTFVGWSPTLKPATETAHYTALYQPEDEIKLQQTDGEFYFHELTSTTNGLQITGYSTINGLEGNVSSDINYEIEFVNMDTNKTKVISLNRLMNQDEMPFMIGNINGHDATYTWFQGIISLDSLEPGNYQAYIIAKSGNLYTKKLVRNLLGKPMAGNYIQNGKQMWIRNNYYLKTVPMEFFVRNQVVGEKDNNPADNMMTGYSKIYFEGEELKIRGFAHNIGGNYALDQTISRNMILENTKTYKIVREPLSTITDGDYQITLFIPDGFSKTKAWFDGGINIASLEKGIYTIYIENKANINDFAELNDIFNKPLSATAVINGKTYSLRVNPNARYRIELIVE